MHHHFLLNSIDNLTPSFELQLSDNGVYYLEQNLTINSQTVSPTFVYYGGNASDSGLIATVGENLIAQGSGGLYNQGSPFLGSDDNSFDTEGTRYFQASNSTIYDITTEDIVFEAIFKVNGTTDDMLFSKRGTTNNPGYALYLTTKLNFGLDTGPVYIGSDSNTLVPGIWYHAIGFLDRSGYSQLYINGTASGSQTDISTAAATLTTTTLFEVGNASALGSGYECNGNIAYLAMWQRDDWLDTHLQATVAQERFHKLCGTYPQIAEGTATPTSYTRNSSALLDKLEYSDELLASVDDLTIWYAAAATALVAGSESHPEGNTAYTLAETTGSSHYIRSVPSISVGDYCETSVDAKAINRTWLLLIQAQGSQQYAYFDLENGVVGTQVRVVSSTIRALGNDWYRCTIRFKNDTPTPRIRLWIAQADNNASFTSLDQDSLYVANPSTKLYNRNLYNVGNNFPRIVYRKDANGVEVKGYLPEVSATNYILDSETLDTSNWEAFGLTVSGEWDSALGLKDNVSILTGNPQPSFSLPLSSNGVDNLDPTLLINGQAVTPTFRYKGGDADATNLDAWTYGETLTAQGSGGTFNQGSPYLGANDDSFNGEGTLRFQASNTAFADITTEDIVFEAVFKWSTTSSVFLVNKLSTGSAGWYVQEAGDKIRLYISDGINFAAPISDVLVQDAWYHAIVFIDRSGSGQVYINGVASGAAVDCSSVGNITRALEFCVAGRTAGSVQYDSNIAYLAMWKQSDWLDTHLQADIAQERFYKLAGLYPAIAQGTAIPTSYTRATTAYIDKVEYGSEFLPSTNPQSGWANAHAPLSVGGDGTHPTGATEWTMSDDAFNTWHAIWSATTDIGAVGEIYEFSVDVKAVDLSWIHLSFRVGGTATDADAGSFFNIASGVLGTLRGSPLARGIESIGNGWYRCWVRDRADAIGNLVLAIWQAEADNDDFYIGVAGNNFYIANISCKLYERDLYQVGAGHPRICYRKDNNGTDIYGYLPETTATNKILQSTDLSNTTNWSMYSIDVLADAEISPATETNADAVIETSGLSFYAPLSINGVDQLDRTLTINSQAITPTFVYYGGDANATELTARVGETLTAQGSGGSFNQGSPYLGANDDSFNPDGSRYFQATNNTFGDVTTEDVVIELVFKHTVGAADIYILNKRATYGYFALTNTASKLLFYLDGVGALKSIASAALVEGVWYHAMLFADKSGSGQIYINGTASGSPLAISTVGSLTDTTPLTIGANAAGGTNYESNIAYVAMWKQSDWLDTHLQATVAQERFYKLCGVYPQLANGTAVPSVCTRATIANLDKVEYGSELLPSTNPTSGWIGDQIVISEASGMTDPDGNQAYALTEDELSGTHYIYESLIPLDNNTVVEFSVVVKAGVRNWTKWALSSSAFDVVRRVSYDLANGVIGSTLTGDLIDYGIEDKGDGWYRCWVRVKPDNTANCNAVISVDDADGNNSFTGTGEIGLYIANPTVKVYERKLYTVSTNHPRICNRKDIKGVDVKGYLCEDNTTNLILSSDDISNDTYWLPGRTIVSGVTDTLPDNNTNANVLLEAAGRTFDLPLQTAGVDNLDATLTINSQSITPTFRYIGVSTSENMVTYPNDFSTWLYIYDVTVITDTTTDPDGGSTADTIRESYTGSPTTHELTYELMVEADTTYRYGVYVKAINRDWIRMDLTYSFPSNSYVYFNVAAGTVGTVGTGIDNYGIESVGNDWYYCWIESTAEGSYYGYMKLYLASANGVVSFSGVVQDAIYVWGAQISDSALISVMQKWDYGENLTLAGTGDSIQLNQPTPYYGAHDGSAKFNGGRYCQASGNTFADITTEDIVIETVFKMTDGGCHMVNKRLTGTGYSIYTTSNKYYIELYETALRNLASSALTPGAWYHAITFVDRSTNSWAHYINGIISGSATTTNINGNATSTRNLTLGARSDGGFGYNKNIAYVAMWKQSDWLDTHLQTIIAQERFYKLAGIYPQLAQGTALPQFYTRATTATLDKVEYGNEFLPSTNPTTGWLQSYVTASVGGDGTHPNGSTEYTLSEDDATFAVHCIIEQTTTIGIVVGDVYEFSVDVKAVNRNWVNIYFWNNGTATNNTAGSFFDVENGALGQVYLNSPIDKGIQSLGSGWYRCWVRDRADLTNGYFKPIIAIGEANGDMTFIGLNQNSLYIANPTLKKYSKELYQVGANHPRICHRKDANGLDVYGYLSESASTNDLLQSEAFNTTWGIGGGEITTNQDTAPDYEDTADVFIETSGITFYAPFTSNGIGNLEPALTLNSTTVYPSYRYKGGDANTSTWNHWGYGEPMSIDLTGNDPTPNYGSPYMGPNDDSVKMNEGKRYISSTNRSTGTKDFVVEFVGQFSGVAWNSPFTTAWAGTSASVFLQHYGTTKQWGAGCSDGTNIVRLRASAVVGAWYHILIFGDRDGNARGYINGQPFNATDSLSMSAVGSINENVPIKIGGFSAPYMPDSAISYFAMWEQDSWLGDEAEWTAVAQERFYKLCGIYPQIAKGTALPISYTRAITATLDKVVYGDETLPVLDLSSAEWHPDDVTVTTASGILAPDDSQAYLIHENSAINTDHFIWDTGTIVANQDYEVSVIAKAINRNWLAISSNGAAYFNLSTGELGTASSPIIDAGMEDLGDGWYRCWTRSMLAGGTVRFYLGEADNDAFFTGLDQDSLHLANPTVKVYERKLYTVGAGHPRVCYRKDANGLDVYGYLPETTATNLITDSEDFGAASWTANRISGVVDGYLAPDGSLTADCIEEDDTAAQTHYIYDTINTLPAGKYVFSVFAKADNRNWLALDINSATDGTARVYFDLSTGSVGTESSNDDAGIEDWGNGWFRCWVKDTRSTVEVHYFRVFIAEADEDITFDGLSQSSLYLWGAQIEANVDYPTSYIRTSSGTVTRNADVLCYKGDDGNIGGVGSNKRGSMQFNYLIPEQTNSATRVYMELNDGGVASERIILYSTNQQTTKYYGIAGNSLQWSFDGTTDVYDNIKRTHRLTWKINEAKQYVDGTEEGTADTSCNIPDDLDRVYVGTSFAGQSFNGLISNVKIWDTPTDPTTSDASEHSVFQPVSLVISTRYVFSIWAKAGTRDWLHASVDGENWSAYFNLSTGSVGTETNVTDAGIEDWGNGWFRCWFSATATATADNFCHVGPASADNTPDFTYNEGDGSVYLWGAQLEADHDYPTSYIKTTTTDVTRNADVLYYKGDDGNIGGVGSNLHGALEAQFLLPIIEDSVTSSKYYIAGLSDGGSASNRIAMYSRTDSNNIYTNMGASPVLSGNTNPHDNTLHTSRITWKIGEHKMYLDDVEDATPSTNCIPPDNLDRIEIGYGVGQANGLISNVKVSDIHVESEHSDGRLHGVQQLVTLSDASKYIASAWIKGVERSWARLYVEGEEASCYFNLATNTVGTSNNTFNQGMEDWGNGWFRCWMAFVATADSDQYIHVQAASADNTANFDPVFQQQAIQVWGLQLESSLYLSSYVKTTSTTANRGVDVLTYVGDDGNIGGSGDLEYGSMECQTLFPNLDLISYLQDINILKLKNQISGGDFLSLYMDGPSGSLAAFEIQDGYAVQANITDTVEDIVSGVNHTLHATWITNNANLCLDSTQVGTPDTSCSIPNNLEEICIGGSSNIGALIHNVKLWNVIVDGETYESAHTLSQDISLVNSTKYIFSIFAKQGNRQYVRLYTDNENWDVYCNLSTGTIGTTTGVISSGCEDWGNGWFRVWFSATATATHTVRFNISPAEADNDPDFLVDNLQEAIYLWGPQLEVSVDYPTSYISTTTTTATRNADVLYYKGDDGNLGGVGSNKRGTMEAKILLPNYDNTTTYRNIIELNDGGSAQERINLHVRVEDVAGMYSRITSADQVFITDATTDILDGIQHTIRGAWKVNEAKLYVDGIQEGTSDTNCNHPDNLDRIYIGYEVYDFTRVLNGLIHSVKIWNTVLDETDASECYIRQPVSVILNGKYICSVFAKQGNVDWLRLYTEDEEWSAYFNLSTGVVGTTTGIIDSGIEDFGNGWFRCWFSATATATTDRYFRAQAAIADNTEKVLVSDAEILTYLFGMQVEASVDYPTSYIKTGSITASRNADVLYYKGDDGNLGGVGSNKRGTMEAKILLPNSDNTVAYRNIIELNDGGSGNELLTLHTTPNDVAGMYSRAVGVDYVNITDATTDIVDGVQHTIRGTWRLNETKLYVDDIQEGTADTNCNHPDDLDRIYIGYEIYNSSRVLNGLISNIKILTNTRKPFQE